MTAQEETELESRLRTDPRLSSRIVGGSRGGGINHILTAADLRALGYDVPDDNYKFDLANGGQIFQENDAWDKIIKAAALGVMGVGGGLEAGALFGGGAPAADASTVFGNGLADVAPTAAEIAALDAAPAAVSAAGTGAATTGIMDRLKDLATDPANWLRAGGAMLSGGAQASASNRGSQIEALLAEQQLRQQGNRDYQNALVNREAEGRNERTSAWKQLQQAAYVQDWQNKAPVSAQFGSGGRDLQGPSDSVVEGARGLQKETGDRLANGNTIPMPTDYSGFTIPTNLTQGSAWEKLMGYLGADASAAGALI